jgi:SAM-dependent methyltransferase
VKGLYINGRAASNAVWRAKPAWIAFAILRARFCNPRGRMLSPGQLGSARKMKLRLLKKKPKKRVAGWHDLRLDGLSDLLLRADGASILDIGCNKGMIGYEFANNGATLVHGIDIYEQGIATAREVFDDISSVTSRFEVVDLTHGPQAIGKAFGSDYTHYDIVLFLAVDHKLQRIMPQPAIDEIVKELCSRTKTYFVYRGHTINIYDDLLPKLGFKRVHYSELGADVLGAPATIWQRT